MAGWWSGLSARERTGILLAVTVILLAGYYLGFWLPLQNDIVLYQKRVVQLEADYRHVVLAKMELNRLQGELAAVPEQDELSSPGMGLLAGLDASIRSRGMADALREIKPDGTRAVIVSLKKVPFDKVVRWLADLGTKGISVLKADLKADVEPGYVEVVVHLQDDRS